MGKIKLKRQLRVSMMGKWRKYRDNWGIGVGRLMRETVDATGVEKFAEKASLNPLPSMRQKILSAPPPYNEKLTMTELPAYCTKKRSRKTCRDISSDFKWRRNHSEDSGRNA